MAISPENILSVLRDHYYPFFLLSTPRLEEALDIIHPQSLTTGEILNVSGDNQHNYVYVLDGSLELSNVEGAYKTLKNHDTHTRPLYIDYLPESTRISAREDSLICLANSEMLDYLLFWDESIRALEPKDREIRRRMEIIRKAAVFQKLPVVSLFNMIRSMHLKSAKKGEEIVRQGDKGEAYYLLTSGRAEVWELGLYGDQPVNVNEMKAGDAFGEQALLTGGTRSATVRMVEDGEMLVMNKSDFDKLISQPMLEEVAAGEARKLIQEGWEIIDVRYQEEFDESHIPGARLVPLHELRHRYTDFQADGRYLLYCHGGKRATVAMLLLKQHAYQAVSMGGIIDWPYETV